MPLTIQIRIRNVSSGGSAIANPRKKTRVAEVVGEPPTDCGETDGELGSDILKLTNSQCRQHGSEERIDRSKYSRPSVVFKELFDS